MLCWLMSEGSASLSNVHLGAFVTRYGVHNLLPLVQWYWVFRVYQHVAEGAQWTKDQLCEDPSHCLRETMDVGQGYSCSGFPDIHFLPVPSWTRMLADDSLLALDIRVLTTATLCVTGWCDAKDWQWLVCVFFRYIDMLSVRFWLVCKSLNHVRIT